MRCPVAADSTTSSRLALPVAPGTDTPAVTTPGQARTETMADPTGNPARSAVHSGSPSLSR